MKNNVTIQDIADALGVSRNTVSKAINNSDGIAESTRRKIIQKAIEMEYKQFSYVSSLIDLNNSKPSLDKPSGDIALFTTIYMNQMNIHSMVVDRIHEELTMLGYTFSRHRVSRNNISSLTLPRTFDKEHTTAIICTEIMDVDYCDMLCSTDIPILFMDGPARRGSRSVKADQLLPENATEIVQYVRYLLKNNKTRIGFIGNYDHCQSFWERYTAFQSTMISAEIPIDERFIIKPEDYNIDDLGDQLDALEEMPDAFICANDYVAIDAMQLLAQKDEGVLNKIHFLGFDDSHESRIFYPSFSTVHIHSQAMAYSAMQLLISRIKNPNMDYRTVHVATDLILREHEEI